MYFPQDVFKFILSFFPKKKRFKFHPITGNCELHYLVQRIGINRVRLFYPNNLLTTYLHDYYLSDNNYLQNMHGDTPLHVAAQYNIFFQMYRHIKDVAPKMAYIKNSRNEIPVDVKATHRYANFPC